MKSFLHFPTARRVVATLLVAGLTQSALCADKDCEQMQGTLIEFQSASASRSKCAGIAPYLTLSPTKRYLVETATETIGDFTDSHVVTPSDPNLGGRQAACNGTETFSMSFNWDTNGGNMSALVRYETYTGGVLVSNYSVYYYNGSASDQVVMNISGGHHPVMTVLAHTPNGNSSITFHPTQTPGTVVTTYTIQTNGSGCTGPSTTGSFVGQGYSAWTTNSATSKTLTNSSAYTPAQISYVLTSEYTTDLLESLGRNDVEVATISSFAARGPAPYSTAKRNLSPDELSISLRKMRTRMTFASVPKRLYTVTWKEITVRDNLGVGTYTYKQRDVIGAEGTGTTTFTNEWILPPTFNGEVGISDPLAEPARMCSQCDPGSGTVDADGVDFNINFGSGGFDQSMGSLTLHELLPVNLGDPSLIRIAGNTNFVEIISPGGVLRQVKAPQMLADVLITSNAPGGVPVAYRIDCFSPSNIGAKDTNGFYQPLNNPYVTWTIANQDGNPTNCQNLLIIETRGSKIITNSYTYGTNGNSAVWTLSAGNGVGIKFSGDDFGFANTNFSRIVQTGNSLGPPGTLTEYFQAVPGSSLEMLRTLVSNATRSVQYKYDQYGRRTNMVSSDGKWARYYYDATTGLISSIQTPFVNSAMSSDKARETVFYFGTNYVSGSGDTGRDPFIPRQTVERVYPGFPFQVTRISSTFTVLGNGWVKKIVATSVNNAWSDTNNQVTTITFYTNGAFKDKILSINYPDTTRTVFFYATNATAKTTTVLNGEADPANSTNVLSGARSIVVTGQFGESLAATNYYFNASGAVLTGSETYEYLDDIGKSHICHYLNGTTRLVQYACCGLEHVEDPDGTSQWFYYDDLKRLTSIQSLPDSITVANQLDGLGRVVNTTQYSSNGTPRFLYGASYDAEGRIATATNALGGVTTYSYTTNGLSQYLVTITNPDGGTRVETYAREGSLNAIGGTAAFPMSFETQMYNQNNLLYHTLVTTRIGDSGATSEWQRDFINGFGRRYATWRPMPHSPGNTTEEDLYFNASRGQLVAIDDEESVATFYGYDALGRNDLFSVDRDGNNFIGYGGLDRITRVTRDAVTNSYGVPVLRSRTFVWDQDNSAVSNVFASSEVSADGLQSWDSLYTGVATLTASNQTAYYSNGLVVITSTAPDNTQVIVTNIYGRRISETSYDAANPRQKIARVTYGYDEFGRQNTVTDDRNGTTTYCFNNAGQISGIQSPPVGGVSLTTSNYFDIMGRVWKTTLPDGTSVTNEYFVTGLLKKTSGSRTFPVEYTYDAQGRVKTMITYGAAGAGTNTWFYNTNRGWLGKRTYPDGTGPSYTYNYGGSLNVRSWVRKSGSQPITTTYTYNPAGELLSLTYSDSTPAVNPLQYNRLGQLTNSVFNGITTKRKYDLLGNLLSEACTGGALNGLTVTNQYDALLRRTNSALLNSGTTLQRVGFAYDAASRLQTVSQLATNFTPVSASYRYVASSPLVDSIAFTNNGAARATINKTYDSLERLTSISTLNSQLSTIDSFAYNYNPAGQRASVTNEANAYWVYQYDALGQVTSARRYFSDGTPVAGQQYDYSFDSIGNLVTASTGGDQSGQNLRTANYTANTRNQYTSRTVPGYIDSFGTAASNATVTANYQPTYRHSDYFRAELSVSNSSALWQGVTNIGVLNNGTNADIVTTNISCAFLAGTPENFLYDGDGNLTNDGRFVYTWDAENRLTSITSYTNAPTASKRRLTFEYDWQGRRIRRGVCVWTNSNWLVISSNKFCYDGWNLIAELNATNNNLVRSYAWGLDVSGSLNGAGGVGGLLWVNDAVTLGSNSTHFVTYDGNGNVSSLVSAGSSAVTAKYEYGPFGDLIQASGAMARANPIRFSSKYQDNETGLLYYGYRFYSPSLGRWLNRDPLEEPGGLNLYGFGGNAAINGVDSDGRVWHIVAGAGIGGAVGWLGSVYSDWKNNRPIDYAKAAQKAVEGAVFGGVAAATFGAGAAEGYLARLALSGGSGFVGESASQIFGMMAGWRNCFNVNEALLAGAIGFVAPVVLDPLLGALGKGLRALRNAASEAGGIEGTIGVEAGEIRIGQRMANGEIAGMGPGAAYVGEFTERTVVETAAVRAANGADDLFATTMRRVENLDFTTGANKAVFYSGPGNRARALAFADRTGALPIDLTPGGKYLNSLNLYDSLPAAQADAIWARASQSYASGASGQISLFVRGARPDRVFNTIERPLIEANPNIYKQIFHY